MLLVMCVWPIGFSAVADDCKIAFQLHAEVCGYKCGSSGQPHLLNECISKCVRKGPEFPTMGDLLNQNCSVLVPELRALIAAFETARWQGK